MRPSYTLGDSVDRMDSVEAREPSVASRLSSRWNAFLDRKKRCVLTIVIAFFFVMLLTNLILAGTRVARIVVAGQADVSNFTNANLTAELERVQTFFHDVLDYLNKHGGGGNRTSRHG